VLVIEDHEFRKDHDGRILHVAPDYDAGIENVIRPFFEEFYTIRFNNYAVDERYLPRHEVIATDRQS
jgi:formylmethanofuran dehydrogenase subunit A